jgi:hypothetical protein
MAAIFKTVYINLSRITIYVLLVRATFCSVRQFLDNELDFRKSKEVFYRICYSG